MNVNVLPAEESPDEANTGNTTMDVEQVKGASEVKTIDQVNDGLPEQFETVENNIKLLQKNFQNVSTDQFKVSSDNINLFVNSVMKIQNNILTIRKNLTNYTKGSLGQDYSTRLKNVIKDFNVKLYQIRTTKFKYSPFDNDQVYKLYRYLFTLTPKSQYENIQTKAQIFSTIKDEDREKFLEVLSNYKTDLFNAEIPSNRYIISRHQTQIINNGFSLENVLSLDVARKTYQQCLFTAQCVVDIQNSLKKNSKVKKIIEGFLKMYKIYTSIVYLINVDKTQGESSSVNPSKLFSTQFDYLEASGMRRRIREHYASVVKAVIAYKRENSTKENQLENASNGPSESRPAET